ncbi:minor capsid protein [Micromonospora sp. NPDC004704]
MATGDGWSSRLLTGLAERLDAAGVGVWRPDGTPYAADEIAIVLRDVPTQPDRVITLTTYPLAGDLQGMADHLTGVQIRVRGTEDTRVCDDLADDVFTELDSAARFEVGGIPVKQMWRQSYTSLGKDTNRRWERSENYYVEAMRPTQHRTD